MNISYDFAVVGGGIVGLATARELQQRFPDQRILLLEKEAQLATHQSGHNSGVIHAGVYYPPGSLKARLCRQGNQAIRDFCRSHDIEFRICGKLLVATSDIELTRMAQLKQRCQENQITVDELSQAELKQREPAISGLGALWVPSSGIVDFTEVARVMGALFQRQGGQLQLGQAVTGLRELADSVIIATPSQQYRARYLVVCGGLQADRLVRLQGINPDFRIVPFRGDYYRLTPALSQSVQHLIYPIPDPDLPFLGVHLTPTIQGEIIVGPNAVLAFDRQGYHKRAFNWRDSWETLSYPGFWKMLPGYFRDGLKEFRNAWYKTGYLKEVQRYSPALTLADLQPYPPGIRAQAITRDGRLLHDFHFLHTARSLHVCNAPSPAATSSIPIARYIVDKVQAGLETD